MALIKICGITTLEEVTFMNEAVPDYCGFVFAPSRRQVSSEFALKLRQHLKPTIQTVGVYVNSAIEEIVKSVELGSIQMVQLHGDEDGHYIQALRKRITVPIIKAMRIENKIDFPEYEVDFYLLDKKSPKAYGGLGEAFNWELLKDVQQPYFLAGGIDLDNVELALAYKPYALDISSGVETNGLKDFNKIMKMVGKVRSNCG